MSANTAPKIGNFPNLLTRRRLLAALATAPAVLALVNDTGPATKAPSTPTETITYLANQILTICDSMDPQPLLIEALAGALKQATAGDWPACRLALRVAIRQHPDYGKVGGLFDSIEDDFHRRLMKLAKARQRGEIV